MNKTFATFGRVLKKDRYLESIQAHFLTLPSYRRFPNDDEFEREIRARDLYNFRSRSYWLRRMENHGRKEWVFIDEYTIEHIMPQNENLSEAWKAELGRDWQQVQATYLHTLGNLTLTGYNPELSDRPFAEKKTMKGGFAESPLRMNEGLASVSKWNKEAIEDRANKLASMAASVWIAPKLSADVLQLYKATPTAPVYSIDDHPHLAAEPLRPIFEEFRKQVLALDPCVTEEFLKLYVAYKAETNFVDVVPQAKRLRLSLNLAFPEINDPRGICKDVTGLGRWGNGDVEVGLTSLDDLPYIIGLVRQAYEKQMGPGAE
jgi:predicted transport protein